MARNLYLPSDIKGFTPEQENEIYQRFARGYNKLKDLPEMKELVLGITSYRKMLKLFSISDEQVALFHQTNQT